MIIDAINSYYDNVDAGLIDNKSKSEHIANYLIANGIPVMPCKIGTTLYNKSDKMEWEVFGFECDEIGAWYIKLRRLTNKADDAMEHTKELISNYGKTICPQNNK